MGEIRSTMDIIMEKTNGLTMTDEEKAELKQRELTGRIKGLIQKFFDNSINLDRLRTESAVLREEQQEMFDQIIKEEAIKKIELEGNNEPVFTVLENTTGIDAVPIHKILGDFEQRLENERKVHERTLRDRLKEKGISGSAVLPNIKADPEWNDFVSNLKQEFREKVEGSCSECISINSQ